MAQNPLSKIISSARQYFYPKEFRIPESGQYLEVKSLIDLLKKQPQDKQAYAKILNDETIIRLVDNIWRCQKGLFSFASQDNSGSTQKTLRLLKEAQEVLKEASIDLQDYTGEKYVEGMVVKRLAFQPCTDEIKRNCLILKDCDLKSGRIIETIKPAIYRDNRLIRTGEVIVCQP